MNVLILTRLELYEKIWSTPMVVLAKEFNLSDNGLRKICKKHNIPTPLMGHWQKIQYGKKTTVIKLPNKNKEEQIKINIDQSKSSSYQQDPKIDLISESIKNNKRLVLKVSDRLSKPDIIVVNTQNYLKEIKPDAYSRIKGTVQTGRGMPSIIVTPKNISRSLRILDNLIKNFLALNYKVVLKEEGLTIIAYEDDEMKISIREICNSVQVETDFRWKTRELIPNGKLALKAGRFGAYEFVDSNKSLIEDQIAKILIKIESDFLAMHEMRARRKLEEIKRKELEKIELEKQLEKENELNKFKQFYNDAHRWKNFNVLKEYFDYINTQPEKSLQTEQWLDWASKKLDWYNPLSNAKEEFLDDVDKDTLSFKKKTWYLP
ncbi:hypothetical protein [Flavobacterium turcicum]|uniref:Uncharacterized protein n=1 Tax=Flavobacterium turcicum TaxID=2764718 RepID=A0ABR7JE46_9FLAO|nr:hypothetical protein [Flavobacterium turcicum]MBC5862775.1 hypothetical protein [Flavobacterium turcicum]NHL01507.1 hypothetical protein [Flavobacterium turcicum]